MYSVLFLLNFILSLVLDEDEKRKKLEKVSEEEVQIQNLFDDIREIKDERTNLQGILESFF